MRSQSSRIIYHGIFLYFTFYIVILCGNSILKVIWSFSFLGYILFQCIRLLIIWIIITIYYYFNELFNILTALFIFGSRKDRKDSK